MYTVRADMYRQFNSLSIWFMCLGVRYKIIKLINKFEQLNGNSEQTKSRFKYQVNREISCVFCFRSVEMAAANNRGRNHSHGARFPFRIFY